MDTPPSGKSADEYMAEAAAAGGTGGSPRGSRSRSRTTGPAAAPPSSEPVKLTAAFQRLHDGVMQVYTGAQMAAMLVDPDAAEAIRVTKDDCVDAWIDLAQKDVKVKNMLTKMTTGAGWGGVVMAHMTLVIPILAKRGWIPGGALFGGAMMNRMSETAVDDEVARRVAGVTEYFGAGAAPGVVTVH